MARLDTLYTAETPEGIGLSLKPAGVVARGSAFAIDLGVRLILVLIVGVAASQMGGVGTAVWLVSFFAIEWLYPVIFELSRSGRTPGKQMMGLQVVMDSGLPVTPAASMTRNLLRAADFMPGFFFGAAVAMLWRRDFKRLGDMAAGTLVVYTAAPQWDGALVDALPAAPARALNVREQAAVLAWAGRSGRLTPERFDELALLAQSICRTPARTGGGLGGAGGTATHNLAGVAQWVRGRRDGLAP